VFVFFCFFFFFFFFFSSRRRHTISLRDWSSDVCSSDLSSISGRQAPVSACRCSALPARDRRTGGARPVARRTTAAVRAEDTQVRSEERRVGKELRLRCMWKDMKKKVCENAKETRILTIL